MRSGKGVGAPSLCSLSDDILAAYCPVLYLHHDDEYRPVSVEWFIERAQLVYYPGGVTGAAELHELDHIPGGVEKLIPSGQVTQDTLLEAQATSPHPSNLSLTVAPEHYGGSSCDQLGEVPIYAHAKLVVDDAGAPEAYEINYITFYAFNGAYHLPANLPLFRTGHHVGDWEHLTVRLDAASRELQGVWYNAHRNIEGEWCPAAAVPRTPCGRIVGYVAINGHGIYPHCGTIPRLFCVANDRTSRHGAVWSPARIRRLCGLAHGSGCPRVPSRGCSLPYKPSQPICSPPLPCHHPHAAAAATATATNGSATRHPGLAEGPGSCLTGEPSAGVSRNAPEPEPKLLAVVLEPAATPSSSQRPAPREDVCCAQGEAAAAGGSAAAAEVGIAAVEARRAAAEAPRQAEDEAAMRGAVAECFAPGRECAGGATAAATGAVAQQQCGSLLAAAAAEAALSGPAAAAAASAAVAPAAAASAAPGHAAELASRAPALAAGATSLTQGAPAAEPAEPLPAAAAASAAASAPAADQTTSPSEVRSRGDGGGESSAVHRGREGPAQQGSSGRRPSYPPPEVVHDTSPWQCYRGFWGSVVSATQQGWFLGAEPPISRGCLRRVLLPCARGVERLERLQPQTALATTPSALRRLLARLVG